LSKLTKAEIEQIKKNFRINAPKVMHQDLKLIFDYIASLEKELGNLYKQTQTSFIDNNSKTTTFIGSDGKPKGQITITKEYLKKRYE